MGPPRRTTRLLALVVSTLTFASAALGAEIETLLMPGKVTSAHAKLESECANCHDRTDRSRQGELCADCHKPIGEDMRAGRGFHGRLLGGVRVQCRACHSEHQGREADIVKFVPEQFDHERTDFALRGAHELLTCASCHKAGTPHREAAGDCATCHKKDEPHAGTLGKKCASCHDEVTWAHVKFDHGKTEFKLTGRHAQASCVACHFNNRYDGTPKQCVSCHAPDDSHRGERGNDCGKCHTTSSWSTQRFDHARETGFALLGAHARTDCTSCHTTGRMQDPVPKDCHGCHKSQDGHAGRLGVQCKNCHTSERWQAPTFNHGTDTKYKLEGKHADVQCHACHTANTKTQKLKTTCGNCHQAHDVHAGKLGQQCETCHTSAGWRASVRFDHDFTDFPLVGQHVAIACEQCHLTPAYKDVASDCHSCHRAVDKHEGRLGRECDSCHSPNGWNIWEFDHAKATDFALTGAHEKLACAQCHRSSPTEVQLSRDCWSCHAEDDEHFGEFGRLCQRCHSTISFRQVRIR